MQAKPTASPLQVARSRQAHRFSIKKEYKEWEIEPITSLAPGRISSRRVVAGREIKPQYKSKPNIELSKPNTEHKGVYQKKKNPQYTNQNQTQ